jgi:hypothetical protein
MWFRGSFDSTDVGANSYDVGGVTAPAEGGQSESVP